MKNPLRQAASEQVDKEWQQKCWGQTRCLQHTPNYSEHELLTIPKTYCSLHYHNYRANKFKVLSGEIAVVSVIGPQINVQIVGPGSQVDIPSIMLHMFVVINGGRVIEEYYSDRIVNNLPSKISLDDIIRLNEGGMVKQDRLSDKEDVKKLVTTIIESIKDV